MVDMVKGYELFGRAVAAEGSDVGFFLMGDGRPDKPRRWALPMTALRVMSPRMSAISLALNPWDQRSLSC